VNPTGSASHNPAQLQQLATFNAGLERPLSIVHLYQQWTNLTPDRQIRRVLDLGAIPMIDWKCGDSDADIIAGVDDSMIVGFAQRLAALQAPIFLRWYYEPNFPKSANYARCIGDLGPAGYKAAFRHIHQLFVSAGATNVAFVWCLAMAGWDRHWLDYYPGAAYVDWIAADGYNRSKSPARTAFGDKFRKWYRKFSAPRFGKPLMVSETGASSDVQQSYLNEVPGDILGTNAPQNAFPLIRAFVYFDAPGRLPYQFSADGQAAFSALSRTSVFLPPRSTASTIATASPDPSLAGQAVRLTAAVGVPHRGGSVTFLANGAALQGCAGLPVYNTVPGSSGSVTSCAIDSLSVGAHDVVAVYSGTAEYAPTVSASVTVTVRARNSGVVPPRSGHPGAGHPGTGQPGVGQPGVGQPGAGQPAAKQPTKTSCGRFLTARQCRTFLSGIGGAISTSTVMKVPPPQVPAPSHLVPPGLSPYGGIPIGWKATQTQALSSSTFIDAGSVRPTGLSPVPSWVPVVGIGVIMTLVGYIGCSWLSDRRRRGLAVRPPPTT
jgi:endoglucanase